MTKRIGLFKELVEDEELIFESKLITPIVFLKEAEIKKLIGQERKEVPIAYAMANTYLTDKRLLFLILYQLEARDLVERGSPKLSGVAGSWFEMPISAISEVEIRPVFIRKDRNMQRLAEWIPSLAVDRASSVELIYDEKAAVGRAKDYMESMLKMGFFTKIFKKVLRVYDKLLIIGEEIVSIAPTLKSSTTKEIVERAIESPSPPPPPESTCPTCGSQATFIEKYQRYYCYNCKKYLEITPPPPPEPPAQAKKKEKIEEQK